MHQLRGPQRRFCLHRAEAVIRLRLIRLRNPDRPTEDERRSSSQDCYQEVTKNDPDWSTVSTCSCFRLCKGLSGTLRFLRQSRSMGHFLLCTVSGAGRGHNPRSSGSRVCSRRRSTSRRQRQCQGIAYTVVGQITSLEVILLTDPLLRLHRALGITVPKEQARCRSFLIDSDGILRFDLTHDLNGRDMSALKEMLIVHQGQETPPHDKQNLSIKKGALTICNE